MFELVGTEWEYAFSDALRIVGEITKKYVI